MWGIHTQPLSLHLLFYNVHIAQNNQYTKVAYLGWHNMLSAGNQFLVVLYLCLINNST